MQWNGKPFEIRGSIISMSIYHISNSSKWFFFKNFRFKIMFITRWILISSIPRCSSKPLRANTRSLFLGIYPICDFFNRNRGKHRRLCGAFTFLLSDLTSNRFICYSSGQFWSCHPRNRKEWEPVINDWQGTLPTGAWG